MSKPRMPMSPFSRERRSRTPEELEIIEGSRTARRNSIGPTEEEFAWGVAIMLCARPNKTVPRKKVSDEVIDMLTGVAISNIPAHALVGALAYDMVITVGDSFSAERWRERKRGHNPDEISYYRTIWNAESNKHEHVDFREMVRVRASRRKFYKSLRFSPHFFELARAALAIPDQRFGAHTDMHQRLFAVAYWLECASQLWSGSFGDARELAESLRKHGTDHVNHRAFLMSLLEGATEEERQVILQRFAETRDNNWHLREIQTTLFPPWLTGTRGEAKKQGAPGHQSAARGLLVKRLNLLIPEFDGQRYGTIAGLLEFAGIEGLTSQNVRSILKKGVT